MSKYDPSHAQETNAVHSWQSATICWRTLNWQDPQSICTNGKQEQAFPHGTYKDNTQTVCTSLVDMRLTSTFNMINCFT